MTTVTVPKLPLTPEDFPSLHPHFSGYVLETLRSPTVEEIARLHASVRQGTIIKEHDLDAEMLYMAMDPSTGDSLLHTAIAAQRIDALRRLLDCFRHNPARFRRAHELLAAHQNHEGTNIMHVAVKTGSQLMVTATFRTELRAYLPGEEMVPLEEPPEEADLYCEEEEDDLDGNFSWKVNGMLFLMARNVKGQTTADEARACGHDDIAKWLDRLFGRYDPHRESDDPVRVEHWREFYATRLTSGV